MILNVIFDGVEVFQFCRHGCERAVDAIEFAQMLLEGWEAEVNDFEGEWISDKDASTIFCVEILEMVYDTRHILPGSEKLYLDILKRNNAVERYNLSEAANYRTGTINFSGNTRQLSVHDRMQELHLDISDIHNPVLSLDVFEETVLRNSAKNHDYELFSLLMAEAGLDDILIDDDEKTRKVEGIQKTTDSILRQVRRRDRYTGAVSEFTLENHYDLGELLGELTSDNSMVITFDEKRQETTILCPKMY